MPPFAGSFVSQAQAALRQVLARFLVAAFFLAEASSGNHGSASSRHSTEITKPVGRGPAVPAWIPGRFARQGAAGGRVLACLPVGLLIWCFVCS